MEDFEKLGVFYLGRDSDSAKESDRKLLLYDSRDLVQHALCVGMTGSGKTGLCIDLIEEAAIDNIPCIVIDPKGDLADLLLTFPDLDAKSFRPWINEDEARSKEVSPDDYASQQADLWKKGLAGWGQDGNRIKKLKDAADFTIYTPASNAGIPVSILKSFSAPGRQVLEDMDLMRERIGTTATSLLELIGVEADPVRSREHILISMILDHAWRANQDLDLWEIIRQIQTPPVTKVGVVDLESFFPAKDRFELAMKLNQLLAAPGFEMWMQGEALDIDAMLHTSQGKPRISIFSIAHLNDLERMFFVSLLLTQVLGWMRTQPGTTSLRAILYMDEIFGFFPPVADPPSKGPLLSLLKQARAFGVGVVLATQNPVDLDYKGLANIGTWFIGRLQAERDKLRILDGLEGAYGSGGKMMDRKRLDGIISGLNKRIFLMHNVHEDEPVVFETRWALSYLSGPLTRQQIKTLMDPRKASSPQPQSSSTKSSDITPATGSSSGISAKARLLPPDISQFYLPIRNHSQQGASLLYHPMVFASAGVYYVDAKAGVATQQSLSFLAEFPDEGFDVNWKESMPANLQTSDLEKAPSGEGSYSNFPGSAAQSKNYDKWSKSFLDSVFQTQHLQLWKSPSAQEVSRPGEEERDFRIRMQQSVREKRDQLVAKLREKYAPRLAALEDRIRKAEQSVNRESEQASAQKVQTAISFGTTLLGAIFGRKKLSASTIGRATTAARGVGRSMKESEDVNRAKDNVDVLRQQYQDLEGQLKTESDSLVATMDPTTENLEKVELKPGKTNIKVQMISFSWVPFWQTSDGKLVPAWNG
jgi:Helicase HerA, central domain